MRYIFAAIVLGCLGTTWFFMLDGKQADALRVLEAEGVTTAETSYGFFGCGEGDTFNVAFSGIKGKTPVEGNVCSGFLKGQTVRYSSVN